MEKQERDQLLDKISTIKAAYEHLEAENDPQVRQSIYEGIRDIEDEVQKDYHKLFKSYVLRHHLERMLKLTDDLIIGQILLSYRGDNAQNIVYCLDRLLEMDRLLQKDEMDYLFHFEESFDEGTNYILYLGSQALVKEWWATFDDYVENREYKPFMYIPTFLRYAVPFLEKHKENPGLIQIWASPF